MSFARLRFDGFTQVRKPDAFRMFVNGIPFAICPNDLRPGFPFAPHVTIYPESRDEWVRKASVYAPDGDRPRDSLWEGDAVTTAWHLMMDEWRHYNLGPGMGSYARFYAID